MDLRDEIFQCSNPVLVGVDAASTYCYLLKLAEHRDADTWGCHVLDAVEQGLAPTRTIADAGSGLRAGHQAAFGQKSPAMAMSSICSINARALPTASPVRPSGPPPAAKTWSRKWPLPNRKGKGIGSLNN